MQVDRSNLQQLQENILQLLAPNINNLHFNMLFENKMVHLLYTH